MNNSVRREMQNSTVIHFSGRPFRLLAALAGGLLPGALGGKPIAFDFSPQKAEGIQNPFARELWAEVSPPSGRKLILPAFYVAEGRFEVRVRAEQLGTYKFGGVLETTEGRPASAVSCQPVGPAEFENHAKERLPAIIRDPKDAHGFIGTDGRLFVPVGANLAWAEGDCVPYYQGAIAAFAEARLNWMRVWMVHWSSLNLDWIPEWLGPPAPPGGIDPTVADNWDHLVDAAEERGVYLQIVLQHHGQYTSGANSNWKENPWNAANPRGFLKSPSDFFTDPRARLTTMMKYRYIVARWGWSPAVFAWELFNEVHWVDAIDRDKNEAAVARWHGEMADFIRSVDMYRHLLTTSTANVASPIYEKMDFLQPHLYASNLLAGARSFTPDARKLDRPVFYGEFGDDHLLAPPGSIDADTTLVPAIWAGIMGESRIPAQPWKGAELLKQDRLGEIGAVNRFMVLSGFARQRDLVPFSAFVDSPARVPLVLPGGQTWERRAPPDIDVPLDGRMPLGFADIPRIYTGWATSVADGYPDRATYHFELPRPTVFRPRIVGVGNARASIRFVLDGKVVVGRSWQAKASDAPTPGRPFEPSFPVPAGRHTLVVENPGDSDWVDVEGIDLGFDTAVLAAVGQRNDRYICAWVWHRTNLYAVKPEAPAEGTLTIDRVPAGTWSVTWWDTVKGVAGQAKSIAHTGGDLILAVPPITRHSAVVLIRSP